MSNKYVELWNKQANKSLRSEPSEWFSYYIGNSYLRATRIGLKHVPSNKINLLKTDLWNEGIEYERDVLGHYQYHKDLNLYGIDISPFVCLHAKSRANNIHILCGDIRRLPLEKDLLIYC